MPDTPADTTATEAAIRAQFERGIALVGEGDHEGAIAEFAAGREAAEKAGLRGLVAGARLNEGYAFSVAGDHDEAIERYALAVQAASEAGDTRRHLMALMSDAAELRLVGRNFEAVIVLDEYLGLLPDDAVEQRVRALIDRGIAKAMQDKFTASHEDLEEAWRLAHDAGLAEFERATKFHQAEVYVRDQDPTSATMLYESGIREARDAGDTEMLKGVLLSAASVARMIGTLTAADAYYTEAEELYRAAGDTRQLAGSLYWHATTLKDMDRPEDAYALWQEEEGLLREMEETGALAECLFAQAELLREYGEWDDAVERYAEAAGLFGTLENTRMQADALYWLAMSLWSAGRNEEAAERAAELLEIASVDETHELEGKALGMRAMALADAGDTAGANEALDAAGTLCEERSLDVLAIWMLARRAYVMAREGRTGDEVAGQMETVFRVAFEREQSGAGEAAIRRISDDIVKRVSDEYAAPLGTFKETFLTS